jgi:predicted CXXCH cytochrome family protein
MSREASFPHVSAGGGSCVDCHNPHAGDTESLLKEPLAETCVSCHDPGGSSSGEEGRYVTHGGELACTSCHNPHGGDRPLLLAEGPIELCGSCHSHEHSVSHPMGEATADPRTGRSMDCLSCHGIHNAPHEKYLHRSGDRELCVGCHKAKVGRSG